MPVHGKKEQVDHARVHPVQRYARLLRQVAVVVDQDRVRRRDAAQALHAREELRKELPARAPLMH